MSDFELFLFAFSCYFLMFIVFSCKSIKENREIASRNEIRKPLKENSIELLRKLEKNDYQH